MHRYIYLIPSLIYFFDFYIGFYIWIKLNIHFYFTVISTVIFYLSLSLSRQFSFMLQIISYLLSHMKFVYFINCIHLCGCLIVLS